ncbi:hypothetical protein CDAR_617181 [Caerostris darwini]|uniref:Endonuclease/exonuclease/phosphatase domain-containing protein n=1 Tax=Caerostris darwini TaxID=1538125 RepID=A0AAV4NVF7_9ARAC|nr:hypothetical protein CDAR_617181 [Caerostris darwini]
MWIEKFPDHRVLLFDDFNAKSRVWGKRNMDERGNQLLSFCNNFDLSIENSPDLLPTYDSTRGQSWIDLLITKNIELKVLDEISNSDHNLLQVTWYTENCSTSSPGNIHISNSNWLFIKKTIFHIINKQPIKINTDLNSAIESLQHEIRTKCTNNSKTTRTRKRNAVWWTWELKIKRSKTRALCRLYQKEYEEDIRKLKKAAFKKCQAEYKKLIIRTKREKFKDFINNITTKNCFGKNFQIILHKKNRAEITNRIIKEDGSLTETIQESISTILKNHFPFCPTANFSTNFSYTDPSFLEISSGELEAVVQRIKYNKASGRNSEGNLLCQPGIVQKSIKSTFKSWYFPGYLEEG